MSDSGTKDKKKIKVAVGLSGGVDSSVAAHLLLEQGYDVVGVHIQCWDSRGDGCTADEDRKDAVKVATKLGIRFEALNYINEYKNKVIDYFYSEYRAGRTPNPDVVCNKEIKFGMFLDWAMKNGFDMVATGHYAQVVKWGGFYRLLQGVDIGKDQSYFLYLLDQERLSKTLLPVGGLRKKEVRAIAQKLGLHTAAKPDSVGICFIGEVDIREFLKKQIAEKPGNVVDSRGEVIGRHEGVYFYTIGQRHGFKVDKYFGTPLYVVSKNADKNELVVGSYEDAMCGFFAVEDLHWIAENPFVASSQGLKCRVRIRHLGEIFGCQIKKSGEDRLEVVLSEKIFGVASGQSAVFYLGNETLGGGVIR